MTITDQINAQLKSVRDEANRLTDLLKGVNVDDLRTQAGDIKAQVTTSYEDVVKKAEELRDSARDLKLDKVQKKAEDVIDSLRKDAKKNVSDITKKLKS